MSNFQFYADLAAKSGARGDSGANSSRPIPSVNYLMKYEKERLTTFVNWKNIGTVTKEDLALSGFFSLLDGDKVQCAFCEGILSDWEEDDKPDVEHRAQFPNCPFMNGKYCGNVRMGSGSSVPMAASGGGVLMTASGGGIPMAASGGSSDKAKKARLTEGAMDVGHHQKPNIDDKKYWEEKERLKTFRNWKFGADKPRREDLAKGGFVYLGDDDKTQCVFCKMIISEWEDDDIVMDEHKAQAAKCKFVKGEYCGNVPMKESENVSFPVQATEAAAEPMEVSSTKGEENENVADSTSTLKMPVQCSDEIEEPMEASNETNNPEMEIVEEPIVIDIEDHKYKQEMERLRTFRNWKFGADKPRKEDLAKGGFVYLGEDDKTQCVFCKMIISAWEDDDDVMEEHKSQSAKCEFVNRKYCGNIPIKH